MFDLIKSKDMKYKKNWEVEFCWEWASRLNHIRYYYWRIAKKDLNLFQRLFSNPWFRLKRAFYDDWTPCFKPVDYKRDIEPIKTYGDLVAFRQREQSKIDAHRQIRIDKGEIFPDE